MFFHNQWNTKLCQKQLFFRITVEELRLAKGEPRAVDETLALLKLIFLKERGLTIGTKLAPERKGLRTTSANEGARTLRLVARFHEEDSSAR